jgi:hypothetical protein
MSPLETRARTMPRLRQKKSEFRRTAGPCRAFSRHLGAAHPPTPPPNAALQSPQRIGGFALPPAEPDQGPLRSLCMGDPVIKRWTPQSFDEIDVLILCTNRRLSNRWTGGKPPDLAIRGDIEIPDQTISARRSLRRNDDKALPARPALTGRGVG